MDRVESGHTKVFHLSKQSLQELEIPSAALCTALRRYSTIPRAPVALVRRPSRLPRARTRRLPILHQPIASAQLPLPVTRSMHLAESQSPEPPTALSLNSTIPRAPVASVRRPPRCRWSTSRPSPQLHIHCLSPPLSHSAAQSMPIAKFQSPGAADSAPPGIHASEGASGVHTPPSTMAASPISPATPTSGIVSLAPADAAPSPRVAGAHSPLACVAVVTHSPQSTDGCPTAWVQTKATVTFPNGLAPEAESLAALGLYPLNNALTAPTNRATHPLFSDSLPNTDSTWHACGSPHGPLLRQLA